MRRIGLAVALTVSLALAPFASEAQEAGKVYRIGFLGPSSASTHANRVEALRAGLRELGYVEEKNILIENRWAEGKYDRLPGLAAELVHLKVDVLVTFGTPGTLAAKQTTTTIPIVMAGSGDAVATGIVSSLARPGGNITGSTLFIPELMAKRLELLKEAMPRTGRVAVLVNPDNSANMPVLKAMEATARSLKVELQKFEARGPNEFESAFSAMAKSGVGAAVVNDDALFNGNARAIGDLAARKRLPLAGTGEIAEAGGSIGYGVSFPDQFRRAAVYVDKILKGAKPGDLPVEQPTKFELLINLKTAKALGLTIPHSLLLRADQVIQ
jgi:putative tryptophan/tyrosine transport system substrate-binding protein